MTARALVNPRDAERGELVGGQRLEPHLCRAQPTQGVIRWRVLAADRTEHQHGRCAAPAVQVFERGDRSAVCEVQIIENQDQRCVSIDQGHNGFERIHLAEIHCRLANTELRQYSTQRGQLCRVYLNLAECCCRQRCCQRHIVQALLQDRAPRTADSNTVQRRCELLEQPRLANARLAFDQRERRTRPQRLKPTSVSSAVSSGLRPRNNSHGAPEARSSISLQGRGSSAAMSS